ncbi:hypothetical protein ACFLQ8_03085 [Candidatus Auribacterota bacterium]
MGILSGNKLRIYVLAGICVFLTLFCDPGFAAATNNDGSELNCWEARRRGAILEIYYGRSGGKAQYAALHLDSSYFRMIYGPGAGWGTSVILMPSFWTGGRLCQGADIGYDWSTSGTDAIIDFEGNISGLQVRGKIRLFPPKKNKFIARVDVSVSGNVKLDRKHKREAFKPLMLSSMRVSEDKWDTDKAFVGKFTYKIPKNGWIKRIPSNGKVFGLEGGSSRWKRNAPTIKIILEKPMRISGWVTKSSNPNDDNVGLWVRSRTLMRSWKYLIVAKP